MLFGRGWRGRLHDIAAFLLVGGIFVLGLLPFLAAMAPDLAAEGDFFGRGGGFADVFSADLLGYLLPTRLHPWLGTWVAGLAFPNDKGQQIYLGYGVLLLALLGVWGLWRGGDGRRSDSARHVSTATTRRWLLFWGAAAVLFFLLTLGPQLRWAGQPLPVPGPFALVSRLPFFSGNRYPSRYSVMLLLAAAVLAGAGIWWILTQSWVRTHKGWAAVALGGIACLVLLEHLSVPLPLSDQQIPAIYARLAAEATHTVATAAHRRTAGAAHRLAQRRPRAGQVRPADHGPTALPDRARPAPPRRQHQPQPRVQVPILHRRPAAGRPDRTLQRRPAAYRLRNRR